MVATLAGSRARNCPVVPWTRRQLLHACHPRPPSGSSDLFGRLLEEVAAGGFQQPLPGLVEAPPAVAQWDLDGWRGQRLDWEGRHPQRQQWSDGLSWQSDSSG